MAKKKSCSVTSNCRCWGWLILIIGLLLVVTDLGYWDFAGIQPWTLAFLVVGLWKLTTNHKC